VRRPIRWSLAMALLSVSLVADASASRPTRGTYVGETAQQLPVRFELGKVTAGYRVRIAMRCKNMVGREHEYTATFGSSVALNPGVPDVQRYPRKIRWTTGDLKTVVSASYNSPDGDLDSSFRLTLSAERATSKLLLGAVSLRTTVFDGQYGAYQSICQSKPTAFVARRLA
jgi:hypothetical protein